MVSGRRQEFTLSQMDGVPVVEIKGEVDLYDVEHLEACLQSAAERDAPAVIVSLRAITYFDSAFMNTLLKFRTHLRTTRRRLLLVKPEMASAARLLEISGLSGRLGTFDSVDDALGASGEELGRTESGKTA